MPQTSPYQATYVYYVLLTNKNIISIYNCVYFYLYIKEVRFIGTVTFLTIKSMKTRLNEMGVMPFYSLLLLKMQGVESTDNYVKM